jgi:hypothetical protein
VTTAADPGALRDYRTACCADNQATRGDAAAVSAALANLAGSESLPPLPDLGAALRAHADQADQLDTWVGEVGDAVADADRPWYRRLGSGIADFGRGAWDGVKDPATMVWGLTPFSGSTGQAWRDLGSGLWYGVTNPLEFGKAVVGWEHLSAGEYSYWAGNLLPGAAATVFTGGGAAAARGASASNRLAVATSRASSATRSLDRFETASVATARWGPASPLPGPLHPQPGMTAAQARRAQEQVNSFRSGTYTERYAQRPVVLHRVHGGTAGELGPYWSPVAPRGPAAAMYDSAIRPEWGNTATEVASIRVPAGERLFAGPAAPQSGHGLSSAMAGGGPQVLIPHVNEAWLVRPLTPAERVVVGGQALGAGGATLTLDALTNGPR